MTRKTGRPMKNLLAKNRLKNALLSFKNPTEENRYLFLKYLEKKYHLRPVKVSLWRGTALHLLEITEHISPEMHQAAIYYLDMSQKMLKGGPQIRISKPTRLPPQGYIPLNHRYHNPEQEEKDQKEWTDINVFLKKEGIYTTLHTLGTDQDLPVLDILLKQEESLIQLRRGLIRLQNYLEENHL